MNQLHPTLRNDVLRISMWDLKAGQPDIQEEFLNLLAAAPVAKTVIVELPNVSHLDADTMRLVVGFQRDVEASGRRFRLNGISQLVSEVLARLGQPASSGRGSHRSVPRAGFVAAS